MTTAGEAGTVTVAKLDINDAAALARFIKANTKAMTPPLVPELSLYLAEESLPIWQKTEEELQHQNIPPPFWAFAWAGGQALARYLLDHPELVAGKTVFDIGTGSGITAIASGLAGAVRVAGSDLDPLSVVAARVNAVLNGIELEVTTDNVLLGAPEPYDVYIIADMFYERELAERALQFAKAAKAKGSTVFVGDPKRSYFPVNEFHCCATYEVAVTRELEDALIKKTSVWQLL